MVREAEGVNCPHCNKTFEPTEDELKAEVGTFLTAKLNVFFQNALSGEGA